MMNKAESVKARYGRNAMKKAPNGRGPGGPRGGFRTPGQSIDKGTLKAVGQTVANFIYSIQQ